jgi:hypothetical protein
VLRAAVATVAKAPVLSGRGVLLVFTTTALLTAPSHGGAPAGGAGFEASRDSGASRRETGLDQANYSIKQAARIWGVSARYAYLGAQAGAFKTARFGRHLTVPAEEVERIRVSGFTVEQLAS